MKVRRNVGELQRARQRDVLHVWVGGPHALVIPVATHRTESTAVSASAPTGAVLTRQQGGCYLLVEECMLPYGSAVHSA